VITISRFHRSRLTDWDDESHAKELTSQSSFDFVEKILISCAQVSEDQPELGEGPVEDVVVVEDHLVVVLLSILTTRAMKRIETILKSIWTYFMKKSIFMDVPLIT